LLHVIEDNRIWPSFIDSRIKESILIGSLGKEDRLFTLDDSNYITLDDLVTVVTYKHKTVLNVLSEIAGLLVLLRIFTFILGFFHEKRFI
jgi:hypothetical protein